jgi:hypothetical protein
LAVGIQPPLPSSRASVMRRRGKPPPGDDIARASIRALLEGSDFGGRYEITHVFRSGFLVEMLTRNLHFYIKRILPRRALEGLERVLGFLEKVDYHTPYGPLANNIAVRIVKTSAA